MTRNVPIETCVARRGRTWADWVGCSFSLAFFLKVLWTSRALGLLLAPVLLHDFVMAFAFLLRGSPRARIANLPARIATYSSVLLVPGFLAALRAWWPAYLMPTAAPLCRYGGAVLWLGGCLLSAWGIWVLRYSFSLEPQAREFVCTGPYRVARHPIYLAYVLTYLGTFLIYPSGWFATVLLTWFGMLFIRIRYEESLLRAVFPEYQEYSERIAMFAPRFRSSSRSPTAHRPAAA